MSKFTTKTGLIRGRDILAKKQEKQGMRVSRRNLFEMAAAGAMISAAARAESDAPTQVLVDLGDVILPKPIAQQMERDIRRAVLMAVATALPHTKFKSLPLPKGARGIIIRRV